MKCLTVLLVCIFPVLFSVSRAEAGTAPTPQAVQAEYRGFAKMAARVLHEEPTLVQNSSFDQKLTLKYQRYAGSQEATQFKMIFSVAPQAIKLEQLAKAYVKYGRELSSLASELPDYVRGHIGMITDADYAFDYQLRYGEVVKTLFSDGGGKLREFKVFDCDYTTQPTDALWYLVHSVELIDRYGLALYGDEWAAMREELREKNKIMPAGEVQAALELATVPVGKKSVSHGPGNGDSVENTSAD